jgi:hypothetical protein
VTIGLNPALNEFISKGVIIPNRTERLPVLADYNTQTRGRLNEEALTDAQKRREEYFRDERRSWHFYFEKLEHLLSRIDPKWSYINGTAAHLDLVGCATNDRWSDLSPHCKKEMVNNCREHFFGSLSGIQNGVMLLLDGQTVMDWMQSAEIFFEETAAETTINITSGRRMAGRLGRLRFREKEFRFRCWPTPAGKLNPVWRRHIAFWVQWTIQKNR